ncbi:hypothetical protein OPU71_18680 [Niveibacterium sp. 24ML]|uniref:hypothetical protein n=1 Tax=Niveibacterium sp. 24ML TaxID=2985512 RepID=UPI00226DE272|nr:hypothetical protein [Niveibacterium sp. 24ML]MCX9158153.1 hypothetical protein [Niveibacterium sp. 24ML]
MDTALRVLVFSSKLLWMIVVALAKIAVGLISIAIPVALAVAEEAEEVERLNEAARPGLGTPGIALDGRRCRLFED